MAKLRKVVEPEEDSTLDTVVLVFVMLRLAAVWRILKIKLSDRARSRTTGTLIKNEGLKYPSTTGAEAPEGFIPKEKPVSAPSFTAKGPAENMVKKAPTPREKPVWL